MNTSRLQDLADSWRAEAGLLRLRGAPSQADILESCVQDLEETLIAWQLEELTLHEAAGESGYSYSSLQQKVAAGEIPNMGAPRKPRIRRCDLPRKACGGAPRNGPESADIADEILTARAAHR